jgi:hypothetical protein
MRALLLLLGVVAGTPQCCSACHTGRLVMLSRVLLASSARVLVSPPRVAAEPNLLPLLGASRSGGCRGLVGHSSRRRLAKESVTLAGLIVTGCRHRLMLEAASVETERMRTRACSMSGRRLVGGAIGECRPAAGRRSSRAKTSPSISW